VGLTGRTPPGRRAGTLRGVKPSVVWLGLLAGLCGCAIADPRSVTDDLGAADVPPAVDAPTPLDALVGLDTTPPGDVPDAGFDAGLDAGFDAGSDAGGTTRDAGADVAADAGRVTTLRVRHGGLMGRTLSLRGDALGLLNWDRGVAFTEESPGVWAWRSAAVQAPFEWKPLVGDMTWSRGPNYRAAPGDTVEVSARFFASAGEVSRWRAAVPSMHLENARGIWVYLPPSYAEDPSRRYPVVYMHDGQNLFDPRAAFGGVAWAVDRAMNDGAEDATVREAIVVGVENTPARMDEYTPTRDATRMAGGRGAQYLRFLVEELKPLIDASFRTLPGREHTALAGSSLGGLITAYAGVHRAEVFGLLGIFSPSTWWDDRMILREVMGLAARPVRPLRVYIDSGDSGPSADDRANTEQHAAAWRALGYRDGETLRYVVEAGGQHNEAAWARRFPGAMRFLLGPRSP
jgi:predicted alpha/beta superfamily hydrolase